MHSRHALSAAVMCLCLAPLVSSQDAVSTDPKHYTVITDNSQVRILKVHYGPHERSILHSHPATVAVFLTDATARMILPDGKTQDTKVKAGETQYSPATTHLPENAGEAGMDLIVIELKGDVKK